MFTAPARKLANALVNASLFVDSKPGEHRGHLAGIRVRVTSSLLDATGTDAYILAQGRTEGTSPGDEWAALLSAVELKPALAALKRARGNAGVDFDGSSVIFTIADERFEVPVMEGVDKFAGMDSLFPAAVEHRNSPGYMALDPALLAKLGKLKDYDAANTRVERFHPHSLAIGLNPDSGKPAVAAFGPDFRLVIAVRRTSGIPVELDEVCTGWSS